MNAGNDSSALDRTEAERATVALVRELAPIGSVTYEPRLTGFAILEDDVMFAFVEADGTPYLRANLRAAQRFHALGATRHPEMRYWAIPHVLLSDVTALREAAYEAADNAHLALSFGIDDLIPAARRAHGTFGIMALALAAA